LKKTFKILISQKWGKKKFKKIKSHGWELGSQRPLFTLHPTQLTDIQQYPGLRALQTSNLVVTMVKIPKSI
jgi:hypothetical protein